MSSHSEAAQAMERAWPPALARWSPSLVLPAPQLSIEQPGLLQVDLQTRQITFQPQMLAGHRLLDCSEALLVHAIGHILLYAGALSRFARLCLLDQGLPFPHEPLVEHFSSLLVDCSLDSTLAAPLCRVYRAHKPQSPLALFLMMAREELWGTLAGELTGPEGAALAQAYPGCRAQAHLLVEQMLTGSDSLFGQFLRFVWFVSRYLPLPEQGQTAPRIDGPLCRLVSEPAPETWAEALVPSGPERQAIQDACAAGWMSASWADRLLGPSSLAHRIAALARAGNGEPARIPEAMAAYYRREAERYLLHLPPQQDAGDPIATPTLEEGEPRLELYLDVSGSMPDPRLQRNVLTLAAHVLMMAALRAGGAARLTLYSSASISFEEWCRSERELSGFLMHYLGGGTRFPFDRLEQSVAECRGRQPLRVVLSDADFDADYDRSPDHAAIFAAAVAASPQLVLLLHQSDEARAVRYARAGARVIVMEGSEDYPRVAAELAGAFLGEALHVAL